MTAGAFMMELVSDGDGKALVRFRGRIFASSADASELHAVLTNPVTSVDAEEQIKALLQSEIEADGKANDADSKYDVELESDAGSIIQCVMHRRRSALVVGRQDGIAEKIALELDRACGEQLVEYMPLPGRDLNEVINEYKASKGYPPIPLWYRNCSENPTALNELAARLRGKRMIIFVADGCGYWELDELVNTIQSEGTPILPVTFSEHSIRVGPLIIGGNVIGFYQSLLGESGRESGYMSAARLLCAGNAQSWTDTRRLSVEIKHVFDELPDDSCFCVRELTETGRSTRRAIPTRGSVLQNRVEGSLWSIQTILDEPVQLDAVAWSQAAQHIRSGGFVSVESAFHPAFARAMHATLSQSDRWKLYEDFKPYFFFHHHNIYNKEDFSPAMLIASLIFGSKSSVEWASDLADCDCSGQVQQSASWYMPGDHSTPHSDAAVMRRLAFVWHLAEEWKPSWGGHLVWVRGDKILPAAYNTLHLFDTRKSGRHFVMQVAPTALGKRFCWNGWWTTPREPEGGADSLSKPSLPTRDCGLFQLHGW
jgi:2OG-Fe(II) oxygenase superfamily